MIEAGELVRKVQFLSGARGGGDAGQHQEPRDDPVRPSGFIARFQSKGMSVSVSGRETGLGAGWGWWIRFLGSGGERFRQSPSVRAMRRRTAVPFPERIQTGAAPLLLQATI